MKKFFLFAGLISIFFSSYSQRWKLRRYEVIGGLGTINMFTDNGVSNAESILYGFRLDFTRPTLNFGLRYKFSQDWSAKINLGYGYGHGRDISNENRGFISNTHIIEPSIQGEFYIKREEKRLRTAAIYNRRGMLNNYSNLSIYAFSGLGGVYYNAILQYQPRDIDEYKKSGFALAIPAGIGIKYTVSDLWVIGYEIGPRYVFSDFLDGFTTIYSKSNDLYWFTSLNIIYKIKTSRRNLPLFLDRKWQHTRKGRF